MILMLRYEGFIITQASYEQDISIVGDQQVWHKTIQNFNKEPHVTSWNVSKILYVISKN